MAQGKRSEKAWSEKHAVNCIWGCNAVKQTDNGEDEHSAMAWRMTKTQGVQSAEKKNIAEHSCDCLTGVAVHGTADIVTMLWREHSL